MRRVTICCLFLTVVGACASRGGWAEGDNVNEEVRRVLVSEERGPMGIAANGVLYMVPPGAVESERRAFLRALAQAEAVRPWPLTLTDLPTYPPEPLPPRPPYDESIRAFREPEVVEIRYPDCTCRVRRTDVGDGIGCYSVDLVDRRAQRDRGWVYHMGLMPSPAVDEAWDCLVDAVARGAAYHHVGVARASPLDTLGRAGVDRGWIRDAN
jgi:hypothetical protein